MKKKVEKKKFFLLLQDVKDFMREMPGEVKKEFNGIVYKLETEGMLYMPYGEKIAGEDLFAIRVIQAGNIRVFYVYGRGNRVYGIHGYVKKTEQIPDKELAYARKVMKQLIAGGYIK